MTLFAPDAAPIGRPYWWDNIEFPTLDGPLPKTAELLVVGAGYTGLSAAIAAHDAGARVVVLDAGQPGKGASTRNGGMLGAHPRLGWDTLAKRYGEPAADALFSEAAGALNWVKKFLQAEEIECDFEETGRIQLAYTFGHFENQKRLADQLNEKSGAPARTLEHHELPDEIATPQYKGGLVFPDHGGLDPAKYHLGMLSAVLKRGIPIVAECPVRSCLKTTGGHRIATPKGEVSADKVVLATNGYTTDAFRWFAARVFPLPSYLIATAPLSPNLIGELAPGRRMMVETRARHSYFRVSPDGSRIIFGGRASIVNIDLERAAHRLRQTMGEVWPQLKDVRLSHVWTGNTGYSFGHMPHVGEREGIHYAMGYSGGGTVLAPWLGRKAGLRAIGHPEGASAFEAPKLEGRWFYQGGRPLFLDAANLWYRYWVDGKENRESRNG